MGRKGVFHLFIWGLTALAAPRGRGDESQHPVGTLQEPVVPSRSSSIVNKSEQHALVLGGKLLQLIDISVSFLSLPASHLCQPKEFCILIRIEKALGTRIMVVLFCTATGQPSVKRPPLFLEFPVATDLVCKLRIFNLIAKLFLCLFALHVCCSKVRYT